MMNKYFYHGFAAILLILVVSRSASSRSRELSRDQEIRPPAVAGTFYPDSAPRLKRMITRLLDSVPVITPAGRILAAIAPHAGYVFSGSVAACTHKMLATVRFDTVVIIGHDCYRDAVAFTCPVDYFETPLGKVSVDREMMEKMQKFNPGIMPDRYLHAHEHTIEVQLPFLQVLGRRCKIVPLLFGNPTVKNCRILADAIRASAGSKTVFVLASTDMSHYPDYQSACRVDQSTLDVMKEMDINRLFSHLSEMETQRSIPNLRTAMCARGGVGTAMLVARAGGADRLQVLRYANSGDIPSGNRYRVVGYCAVLMVKTTGTGPKKALP